MWGIIATALLAGACGFIGGAYWMVRYQDVRPLDLDQEDQGRRSFDQKIADQLDEDSHPSGLSPAWLAPGKGFTVEPTNVTHLVDATVPGSWTDKVTVCCVRPVRDLPRADYVTGHLKQVTCPNLKVSWS